MHYKQKTIKWEKRRYFVYMAASVYHVVSKDVKNRIFKHDRNS